MVLGTSALTNRPLKALLGIDISTPRRVTRAPCKTTPLSLTKCTSAFCKNIVLARSLLRGADVCFVRDRCVFARELRGVPSGLKWLCKSSMVNIDSGDPIVGPVRNS